MVYDNELYHHGILGMKWGVRRYQNYDGSYTRAGMKRYNDSMEKYEKADSRYKNAKKEYKNAKRSGSSTLGAKTEVTNARLARKKAKREVEKHYDHLKKDKMGDQGKDLYSRGKTITGNNATTSFLNSIGTMSLSAAAYNYQTGSLGNQQVTNFLMGVGIASLTVSGAKTMVDNSQNKKLRAYYSHTSNY